jgi:hypothetical protein
MGKKKRSSPLAMDPSVMEVVLTGSRLKRIMASPSYRKGKRFPRGFAKNSGFPVDKKTKLVIV